jgi:hypothetical protein
MSGKVVTEGDRLTQSDTARQSFNIDGAGVKIGIISTSYIGNPFVNSDRLSTQRA